MFWGRSLRQGEVLSLAEECGVEAVLHISHASLSPDNTKEATVVILESEGRKFTLAMMKKGSRDFQDVNLSFLAGSNCSVCVEGPGEVNLLGYFEAMSEGKREESDESSESASSSEEISFLPRSQVIQSPSSSSGHSS